jgi:hypothetical protein
VEYSYAEFVPAAGERIIAGLGTDLTAATASSTIDFAFSLWPGGGWEVRERGVGLDRAPAQINAAAPPVTITSPRTIPDATAGSFYSYAAQAAHVQGIARWELAGGALPPGLTLDAATGVLWGTCPTPGSWSFNARIRDARADDTLTLTLTVR